jgi:hypothetical protein
MKFFIQMKKKEVLPDHSDVCKLSEMFLTNVSWKIWALRGIFSPGEEGRSGRGWTVRSVIIDGQFPSAGVVNEDFGKSDHRPILVDTERLNGIQVQHAVSPLRFEARWLCESSVESIIQTAWDRAKLIHVEAPLSDHTAEVHEALHSWDKHVLKGPRKRMCESYRLN